MAQKISDVLNENTWFQGTFGRTKPWVPAKDVFNQTCLGNATWVLGIKSQEAIDKIAAIVQCLFPERCLNRYSPNEFVVGFNNHDDTVWSDVEKVIHTFEMEEENA